MCILWDFVAVCYTSVCVCRYVSCETVCYTSVCVCRYVSCETVLVCYTSVCVCRYVSCETVCYTNVCVCRYVSCETVCYTSVCVCRCVSRGQPEGDTKVCLLPWVAISLHLWCWRLQRGLPYYFTWLSQLCFQGKEYLIVTFNLSHGQLPGNISITPWTIWHWTHAACEHPLVFCWNSETYLFIIKSQVFILNTQTALLYQLSSRFAHQHRRQQVHRFTLHWQTWATCQWTNWQKGHVLDVILMTNEDSDNIIEKLEVTNQCYAISL